MPISKGHVDATARGAMTLIEKVVANQSWAKRHAYYWYLLTPHLF
jgi:hypothetical protein